MEANVISLAGRGMPPLATANSNVPHYSRFFVVNLPTDNIVKILHDIEAIAEVAAYTPVNFVEFLEMNNHGKFDSMSDAHLIVLQSNSETSVLKIMV
jgi:hypothetical protein